MRLRYNISTENNRHCKNNVLLVSHEMSYTGACHSLLRICKVLKGKYNLTVWTKKQGLFEQEFAAQGLKVELADKHNAEKLLKDSGKTFSLAICNTIVTDDIYNILRLKMPTIWYIREAQNLDYFFQRDSSKKDTLRWATGVYSVSEYAKRYIAKFCKHKVRVLHNAVEDFNDGYKKEYLKGGKLHILMLGTFNPRKAFGTAVEAIKMLPKNYQEQVDLTIAGEMFKTDEYCYQPVLDDMAKLPHARHVGLITDLKVKADAYKNADIVIVPSTDESCSLVVLEAMMMGVPVIVSNNVGAKYLVDKSNGWIFKTGDTGALAKILRKILENKADIAAMGKAARQKYLQSATMNVYEKNILKMARDNIGNSKLIGNAAAQFLHTLPRRLFNVSAEKSGKGKWYVKVNVLGLRFKFKKSGAAKNV